MTRLLTRAALAAALLAAACDHNAAAPTASPSLATGAAERVVQTHVIEFDGTDSFTQVECPDGTTSEPIALFGTVVETITSLTDGAAGLHVSAHTMPVGLRGVGLTTGAAYRVAEREAAAYLQRETSNRGTFRSVLSLVGARGGPRYELVSHGHYRLDAQGAPVIEWNRSTLECR